MNESTCAPSITGNVCAILSALGIQGVEILEELPDRVRALDKLGELQRHIDENPAHWMRDAYDPLHGHIAASYRERCRPSLQVCLHPISHINPNHPPEDNYYELDVDFAPPDGPLDFLRHTLEVATNAVRHRLTDEGEIARQLAQRFEKEKETTDGKPA